MDPHYFLDKAPQVLQRWGAWYFNDKPVLERSAFLTEAILTFGEDDTAVVALLELLRAVHGEAELTYRADLEELYWQLPGDVAYNSRAVLPQSKSLIFQELLKDWKPDRTPASTRAFRRVIAMGWPRARWASPDAGEHELELKARGYHVGERLRETFLKTLRSYLQYPGDWRGSFFGGKEHAPREIDCAFRPWLTQRDVPEEILHVMVMARAKAGGLSMALRDIRP